MNFLSVGTNKLPLLKRALEQLPEPFLLIDDGPLIDALPFPKRRRAKSTLPKIVHFDVEKHHFNPFNDIDDIKARDFISALDAIFPEGQNTLTKKNSNHLILRALLDETPRKRLDTLLGPNSKDPYLIDAYQKLENILLSPVLKNVLCRAKNFSLDGIVLARLDRVTLGDFVCRVLGHLLIALYPGQTVVPHFGSLAAPHHVSLIRQNRLIAGIDTFDEVPEFQQQLLLIEEKLGAHCTYDDAVTLAKYTRHKKDTDNYSTFIEDCID